MNTLKCVIEGCLTEISVGGEPMSSDARYICKNHSRASQVRAANRVYNPDIDEKDKKIRFQKYQFDKDLARVQNTSHSLDGRCIMRADKD
jgi:hypothetical protein